MKRGTRFLFLLLVAANAQKVVENISNGDLKHQLSQIENEQMFDNFRMKSVMDRILQSVEANNKKLEVVMKQAHDDKLEMKSSMDRTLQSVEANKLQMTELLQSHDKMKSSMDHILQSDETKKKQMDDLLHGHDKMKSTMDRTLLSVEANKKQIDDVMLLQTYLPISERVCQKILASWSFGDRNMTMISKAMDRTFYYEMTVGTWKETRDWCSSRGMHLATLKTAEEVKQVANTLKSKISLTHYGFWVSASDIGRSPGQFHWADGTPVLNSTWQSGQPNDIKANQETCASIVTGFEKLWDWPCSDNFHTLCEVPEPLATCM